MRYGLRPKVVRLDINGAVLLKHGELERAPNAPHTGDIHAIAMALSGFF